MTALRRTGRRPLTLGSRLSLVAVSIAALLMAVLVLAFNGIVRHQLDQRADEHLRTRASAVASTVDTTGARARVGGGGAERRRPGLRRVDLRRYAAA